MWTSVMLFAGLVSALPSRRQVQTCNSTTGFTNVMAFGDSLTDNGNGSYRHSNGTWPPSTYYNGRFSNGPVWVELVAQNLSAILHDYAVGGSTTSNALVQGYTGANGSIPVDSVDEAVTEFLGDIPSDVHVPTTLFVVSGGFNDLFYNPNLSAYQSVAVLSQQVQRLQAVGARHFLFFNYYDASLIPFDIYATIGNKVQNRKWSQDYRRALLDLHASVDGSYFYDLANELFPNLYFYGQPTSYGLDQYGAYGSCVVGTYPEVSNPSICDAPDTKVFWDEYHPTRVTHRLFAEGVLAKLGVQPKTNSTMHEC